MTAETLYRDVDINLDWNRLFSGIGRRWYAFVGILGLCTALGLVAALKQAETYTAEAKILVEPDDVSALSGLNDLGLERLGDVKSLGKTSDPVVTESEILRSAPLLQTTINALQLKDDGDPMSVDAFAKQLIVKEIPGTDMLRIAYQSEDPLEAANVVNQLVSAYIEENVRVNRQETSTARSFLEEQLPKTETLVRGIESELRAFREKYQVLALEQQTESLVQTIAQIDQQLRDASLELNEVSQQIQEIQAKLGMNSGVASKATSLSTSALIQQLLVEQEQVKRLLDQERSRFQETHPTVQALRDQEKALQNRLQDYSQQISPEVSAPSLKTLQLSELEQQLTADLVKLEVEQARLQSRVGGLSQIQQLQSDRSQAVPYLEQVQRQLERRLEAAQSTYTALLQRLQEIQLAENQSIGNVRVIANATLPEKADATSKKLLLLGGIITGLLGGTAAALFLDLLDGSVKDAEEAANLLGCNLLGIIPAASHKQALPPSQPFELDQGSSQQALQISSAYNNLQTNVRLLSRLQEPKTLMVTAPTGRDGSSGVVANLAASIAESNSRVLIIDANLEQPAQAEIWQSTAQHDLFEVLSHRASIQEGIQDITPFLSLLPLGQLAKRPLSMSDFRQIELMLYELRKQYDFIVLDAPSLGYSMDASVLGKFVDGIIVVVNPQSIKKQEISVAKQRLDHATPKILGVVSNELRKTDTKASTSLYSASSSHPIFIQ